MYKDAKSCVVNNGFSSEFFLIKRGIRQGCPLSALLFILAVEILSLHIQNNNEIKGIRINNKEIKLTQLADDMTLFVNDKASLKTAFNSLDKFTQCSGLRLNYTKTEVLPIGTHEELHALPVKIVHKAFSLGIWYYASVEDIIEENHKYRIEQLDKIFSRWKCRQLGLHGKATVIKTLAVSKLNYVISTLATPEWLLIWHKN